jgi:hypothetical protein
MRRLILGIVLALVATGCSPSVSTENAQVFFASQTSQGLRLVSETREFSVGPLGLADAALSGLISGSLQPLDPQYENLWAGANALAQLDVEGSVASVDLTLGGLNLGAEAEARAIEQVVWTLTGLIPEVSSVRFLVDGYPVETLAGHVDTTLTFQRSDHYLVLSPVQITSLNEGARLASPLVISGTACTFEANVVWALTGPSGQQMTGATTATAACPDRGSWSLTFDSLEPGSYNFMVSETSAEDGSVVASDDKNFIVTQ